MGRINFENFCFLLSLIGRMIEFVLCFAQDMNSLTFAGCYFYRDISEYLIEKELFIISD